MQAAILNKDVKNVYEHNTRDTWRLTDDDDEIAKYDGPDIIVGLSMEDVLQSLNDRYPSDPGYERVLSTGNSVHCLSEQRLASGDGAVEIAKSKAMQGEIVDLGQAGYSFWTSHDASFESVTIGDYNCRPFQESYVVMYGGGNSPKQGYFLKYDPAMASDIRAKIDKCALKQKASYAKSGWFISKGVKRGRISCGAIDGVVNHLQYVLCTNTKMGEILNNPWRIWAPASCPNRRIGHIDRALLLIEVLWRLLGKKPRKSSTPRIATRNSNNKRDIVWTRIYEEAEIALPALKKALSDFNPKRPTNKASARFAFVSGLPGITPANVACDPHCKKEAIHAKASLQRLVRFLEAELRRNRRGKKEGK